MQGCAHAGRVLDGAVHPGAGGLDRGRKIERGGEVHAGSRHRWVARQHVLQGGVAPAHLAGRVLHERVRGLAAQRGAEAGGGGVREQQAARGVQVQAHPAGVHLQPLRQRPGLPQRAGSEAEQGGQRVPFRVPRAGRPLDLLIANAGTYGPGDATDADTAGEWLGTFAVNTVAPYLMAQALLPEIRASFSRPGWLLVAGAGAFLAALGFVARLVWGRDRDEPAPSPYLPPLTELEVRRRARLLKGLGEGKGRLEPVVVPPAGTETEVLEPVLS